jgi:hypothetical protein
MGTTLYTRDRGVVVRFPVVVRHFLSFEASRPALRPLLPHIRGVPEALSLGLRSPGRETDHSSPSGARVGMNGTIPSLRLP